MLVQWLGTINSLSGYAGQDRVTPLVSVAALRAHSHSTSPEHTPPAAAAASELPAPKTSRSISEASDQHSLADAGGLDDDGGLAAVASRASLSEKALGFLGGFLKGAGSTSASKVCRSRASLRHSRFVLLLFFVRRVSVGQLAISSRSFKSANERGVGRFSCPTLTHISLELPTI